MQARGMIGACVLLMAASSIGTAWADPIAGIWTRTSDKLAPHSVHTCGDADGNVVDGREGWMRSTVLDLRADGRYVLRAQHRVWHGCGSEVSSAEEEGTWSRRGRSLELRPARLEQVARDGAPAVTRRLPVRRHVIERRAERDGEAIVIRGRCPSFLRGDPACGRLVLRRQR